jgi:hypothetical protein
MSKRNHTELPNRDCKKRRLPRRHRRDREPFLTDSDDSNANSDGSNAATMASVLNHHPDNISSFGQLQIVEGSLPGWDAVQTREGDQDQAIPKPVIKPIQRILRENENFEDKAWLTRQEASNKKRNLSTKLVFPTWEIAKDKWAKTEFCMNNYFSKYSVVLEHSPNSSNCFTGLRLDYVAWNSLKEKFGDVMEYVTASENGGSWKDLANKKGHHYQESDDENNYFQKVRFLGVSSDNIYFTLTSTDKNNMKGCQVDIRKCGNRFQKTDINNLVYHRKGITLVGGAFDYFFRFIYPKIELSTQWYIDMQCFMEILYPD